MKFRQKAPGFERGGLSRKPPKCRWASKVAALAFMGIMPLLSKNAKAQEDVPLPPRKPLPAKADAPLEGPPGPKVMETGLEFPSWIFENPLDAGWGKQESKKSAGGPPKKKRKGGAGPKGIGKGGQDGPTQENGGTLKDGGDEIFAPCGMPQKEKEEEKEGPEESAPSRPYMYSFIYGDGEEEGKKPKEPPGHSPEGKGKRAESGKPLDLGMNVVGNEAGEAAFLRLGYLDSLKLDAGSLAFWSNEAAIYGRILATPQAVSGGFKAKYYGSYGFVYNMPSWFYNSHAGAMGYAYPIGKNSTLRMGGILGGAFSLPCNDDLYMNLALGMSLEIAKKVLLYFMPTAYMNTDVPMANSYIWCFKPKLDRVELGLQVSPEGMPSVAAFAKIGWIGFDYGISNEYGLRATHDFMIKNGGTNPKIGIWGSAGITQWSPQAWNGTVDPAVSAGITLSFMGAAVKSTNSIDLSRMQEAKTGKSSINFLYATDIAGIRQQILDSESFDEFATSRGERSAEDTLTRARYLGELLREDVFIRSSSEGRPDWNFFSYKTREAAQVSNEDTFQFLRKYLKWEEIHGEEEIPPKYLREGIAVCSGIHWLVADFLRKNGIDAIVVGVNGKREPHLIVAARLPGRIVLLDYGVRYDTRGTLGEALRFYGETSGTYKLNATLSGPSGYIGTYVTPEGRLVHKAFGLENPELFKKDFLGVK
ncbi:hypothetical protein JW721_00700 [Candidatus Micrarchaeota archaeon]|nr:hypothetical protein [Candidatus Micrarchaeota archaeon]